MANTNRTSAAPSSWFSEPSLSMRPDLASYELESRMSHLLSIPPGQRGTDLQSYRDSMDKVTPPASSEPATIFIITDGDPLDLDQDPSAT